jgi:anti-sigma factor RsiW
MTEDRTHDARKKADKALQEIRVKGNQLVDRVREVIEEGNARRILVKKDGRTVMEFPLSVGVGGAAAAILLSPTLAALGAFASLASDIHVVVERYDPSAAEDVVARTPSETTTTE